MDRVADMYHPDVIFDRRKEGSRENKRLDKLTTLSTKKPTFVVFD